MRNKLAFYCGILLSIFYLPSYAQNDELTQDCVISVLNRTVQVASNGGWTLANVPTFMGQVRARATCITNGQSASGESDFFSLDAGEIFRVEDISFEDPDPIPNRLEFTQSGDIRLTDTSQVNLGVIAYYPDGSVSSTLTREDGINFNSSNEQIAAISPEGVLSPISSGVVIISARVEGVLVTKFVSIALSGDSDGDGLPDDFEIDNGLDPNDPIDAMEDQDSDGISAFDEFQLGTNINEADSDGDTILDGEEIALGEDGFITDPLLFDTDGDFLSDSVELLVGSDPTDPQSQNLTDALDSIEIEQGDFELVFNGVQSEVSAQLSVTGHLIDGTQLDLLSADNSTSFESSDLSVISFGLMPGEVFAGQNGTSTITASNGIHSDSVDITVSTFESLGLSRLNLPAGTITLEENITVQGDFAFLALGKRGLAIVDVSDRLTPKIVTSIIPEDAINDIELYGKWAYVADGINGIRIFDITTPSSPVEVGGYNTGNIFKDVSISENLMAVSSNRGIDLVSLSNPEDPLFLSRIEDFDSIHTIELNREQGLLIAMDERFIHTISVVQARFPVVRYSLEYDEVVLGVRLGADPTFQPDTFVLDGDNIHLVMPLPSIGAPFSVDSYRVVKIAGNLRLDVTDMSEGGFRPTSLALGDGFVFYNSQVFPATPDRQILALVNNRDPENVFYQSLIDFSPLQNFEGQELAVDNRYAYVISTGNTLDILQYIEVKDTAGVAPELEILNIPENEDLVEGSVVEISIDASDDIAVQIVEIYIDDTLVGSDTTYPYSIPVSVPRQIGSSVLTAKAVDFGGAIGVSTAVTVNIQGDIDQDLLGDDFEASYGTDLNNPDTDNDNLEDGLEVELGTDPLNPDTDGDGVSDGDEARQGTNPLFSAERWEETIINLEGDRGTSSVYMENSIVNSGFLLDIDGDFDVVGETSTVNVASLNIGGTLRIDGATLVLNVAEFSAKGIELLNGATLTGPEATADTYKSLQLNVAEMISIDTTSSINMDGKGFLDFDHWPYGEYDENRFGCHGGESSAEIGDEGCSYGRYADVKFAGSGGRDQASRRGQGGGFVSILADELHVDGMISANGASSNERAGAGGGINIEVNRLSGAGILEVQGANGGNNFPRGASSGGRISVKFSDNSQWNGSTSTSGAGTKSSDSFRYAGSGTAYFKDENDAYGSLIIDGEMTGLGEANDLGYTQIENVGSYTISSVNELEAGYWELGLVKDPLAIDLMASLSGSIRYHYFSVSEAHSVLFSMKSLPLYPTFMLFKDDGELNENDFISYYHWRDDGDRDSVEIIEKLGAGQYLLVIGSDDLRVDDVISGNETPFPSSGEYQLEIRSVPLVEATNEELQIGKQGLLVDLDAGTDLGPLYEVKSNTSSALRIRTDDDLTSSLGQKLIGVHQFKNLTIRNGVHVDFGGDRIEAENLEVSDAILSGVAMSPNDLSTLIQGDGDGFFYIPGITEFDVLHINSSGIRFEELRVANNLTVSGDLKAAKLTSSSINIIGGLVQAGTLSTSTLSLDGATLSMGALKTIGSTVSDQLNVMENIELLNGSLLTVEAPTEDGYTELLIDTGNEVYVDATSTIDLTGKGFAGDRTGPNNGSGSTHEGCHAGVRGNGSFCGYGRYAKASFAGSGGRKKIPFSLGNGGGFVELIADSLVLEGSILADGSSGDRFSGAGGGIHIDVTTLTGGGTLSASGRLANYGGSGGRISIYANDSSGFTGQHRAYGVGAGFYSTENSGAGTVYIHDKDKANGSLFIDNGLGGASELTFMEHIGRHEITSVEDLGGDFWQLSIGSSPWQSTNLAYEWGIQGLKVDLDASDETGPLYIVESNTSNSFVISTAEDLSGVVGQDVIGVHQFDQLVIQGGADVDFGGDRIEITDLSNSEISDSVLKDVDMPLSQVQYFLENNIDGVIDLKSYAFNDLTISSPGFSFEGLDVSNSLTLTSELTVGSLSVQTLMLDGGSLEADTLLASNITLNASSLNAPALSLNSLDITSSTLASGNITVAGNVDVLSGSILTVPEPTVTTHTPLLLDVSGDLYVDATSLIDVTGKGFPGGRAGPDKNRNFSATSRHSCHAGDRSNSIGVLANCSYGRYSRASFAGSGGETTSTSDGGGYVKILADQFSLFGTIQANGVEPGSFYYSGAGGGVDIDVTTLSGSGSITAEGYSNTNTKASGGGRISIRGDLSQWSGTSTAYAGKIPSSQNSTQRAGAGTVFMHDTSVGYGSLVIDNNLTEGESTSSFGLTGIEHIGRHEIVSVNDLGNDRWEIGTLTLGDIHETGSITSASRIGSVDYYNFQVGSDHPVRITIPSIPYYLDFILFTDDGSLDEADYIARADGRSGRTTISTFDLNAGYYVLAVAEDQLTIEEAVFGENSFGYNDIAYEVHIESLGGLSATNTDYEYGLQGLKVDLDASDEVGPFHTIESSTSHSFVISSTEDLSNIVGQEFVGVHEFERLIIQNGALVDWGGDRIQVYDLDNSALDNALIQNQDPLGNYPFGFIGDIDPPTIQQTSLGDVTTGLPQNTVFRFKFSEELLESSLQTVELLDSSNQSFNINTSLTDDMDTVLIEPVGLLSTNETYSIDLTGVTDLAGNAFQPTTNYSVTIGSEVITGTPQIVSVDPGEGLLGPASEINIQLNAPLDLMTLSGAVLSLEVSDTRSDILEYNVTLSDQNRSLLLTPAIPFDTEKDYSLSINGFKAINGVEFSSELYSYGVAVPPPPTTVNYTTIPEDGAVNVDPSLDPLGIIAILFEQDVLLEDDIPETAVMSNDEGLRETIFGFWSADFIEDENDNLKPALVFEPADGFVAGAIEIKIPPNTVFLRSEETGSFEYIEGEIAFSFQTEAF